MLMPFQGDKKEISRDDIMEVDSAENEWGGASEDEVTQNSAVWEDGKRLDMVDEDCERMECLDEMANLEKKFASLKGCLYKE